MSAGSGDEVGVACRGQLLQRLQLLLRVKWALEHLELPGVVTSQHGQSGDGPSRAGQVLSGCPWAAYDGWRAFGEVDTGRSSVPYFILIFANVKVKDQSVTAGISLLGKTQTSP